METIGASEDAAARRGATLEAVAFAAQRLLEEPDWQRVIPEIVGRLAEAVEVSRAYVYENRTEGGELRAVLRAQWVAREDLGVVTEDTELDYGGLERWVTILGAGQILAGPVSGFPAAERPTLEAHRVRSLLVVPLMVGGEWWGSIGFDDCVAERAWGADETDALRAAAGTLAAAINRERSERRLREAEEMFRTVVEHLPAVTYREALDDPNPERFYMSPRSVEVFGHTPEQWTWTPEFWENNLHPEDRDRVLALDEETNRTREPFVAEYRFRKADGTFVWIHDEATLVERPNGETYWQGFLLDITLRKEAESALAETEERYRLLVERSPVSIYVQDVDPETGGSVTSYLSPANEALIGYTAEEVAADPTLWTRLIHPDDRERVLAADRSSNADGGEFSLEYRVIHKDGHVVWVQDVATFRVSGDRRYWQGFMLDITERKEAEEKLERALEVERDASQRLRSVDEMKNTFLQAVSHDLRTPLAAILGLAVTLERGDVQLDPAESRHMAGRIAENARKLDRLVTDLLDLDRLARGIVEPKLHPTDVGELVERVVAASDLAAAGRVNLEAPQVVANVDGAKIERIVENLLANAARHTPEDAKVWVRVSPHEAGVLIVVEDDGPGIPAEIREQVFEPFRQGPQSPDHAPGVGVGLALVGRFAELMGGRAWVEERAGGGASFRVYLADGPRTSAEVGTAG